MVPLSRFGQDYDNQQHGIILKGGTNEIRQVVQHAEGEPSTRYLAALSKQVMEGDRILEVNGERVSDEAAARDTLERKWTKDGGLALRLRTTPSAAPAAIPSAAVQATVPSGVSPGGYFKVNVGGQLLDVLCPAGVVEGQLISIQMPASASAEAMHSNQVQQQQQYSNQV